MSEQILLPKNWKTLTIEEQKEWITTYYMLRKKIPEPMLRKPFNVIKGELTAKDGRKLKLEVKDVKTEMSKNNPNLVREYEMWVGKWLFTVFHDKNCPFAKFVGVSNPSSAKWIAQELSSDVLSKMFQNVCCLANKFGVFRRKKRKKRR